MSTQLWPRVRRRRKGDEEHFYWRSTQFLVPIYGMLPGGGEDGTVSLSMYLPIDYHHTLHWSLWWHRSQPLPRSGTKPAAQTFNDTGMLIGGVGPSKPHQSGKFVADWWPGASKANDFRFDYEVKQSKSFTVIACVACRTTR